MLLWDRKTHFLALITFFVIKLWKRIFTSLIILIAMVISIHSQIDCMAERSLISLSYSCDTEEREIIIPAIDALAEKGVQAFGPYIVNGKELLPGHDT